MINLFNAQSLEKTMDKFSTVFALLMIVMMILVCCMGFKKLVYPESQNTKTYKCCHIIFDQNDPSCKKAELTLSDKE